MTGNIVILTGAGISAESGLGTFRDADGIWKKYPLEDVATPEGFARNPGLVHAFYNARRKQAAAAEPNAAHHALARLQAQWSGQVVIVTQNVDALHEAGGAQQILHMHGRLDHALCATCDHRWPAPADLDLQSQCPACACETCRPDVVWFGEMPYHMDEIDALLSKVDLFVSVGTSGQVYPAAGFAEVAAMHGAETIALNLEPFEGQSVFSETRFGPATRIVPDWVGDMLTR